MPIIRLVSTITNGLAASTTWLQHRGWLFYGSGARPAVVRAAADSVMHCVARSGGGFEMQRWWWM